MKKTFSVLLIAVFAAYALYQRQFSSESRLPALPVSSQPAGIASPVAPAPSTPTPAAPPASPSQPPAAPPVAAAPPPKKLGAYKDGTYTGDSVYAYYGYVQVAAVIKDGRLSDVQIYDYPRDRRTSANINSQALPMLISEAVSAQSANIQSISGASDTSPAFKQSLDSALAKAKA